MDWVALIRGAFVGAMAAVLAACLAGILVSGPVVVRAPKMDTEFDISPGRMRRTVERLCTDFSPRDYRNTGNLDRAAAWIAGEFRKAGLEVELQPYTVDQRQYHNVIARRPGSDPASGAVILGAHYDAVEGSPGANDNASGVAVLLELAATLPDAAPRHPWIFAAFATEEPPLFATPGMGSNVFAKRVRAEGTPVDVMIALDLVGHYSQEPGSQRFPFAGLRWLYPNTGNFIAVVGDLRTGPWLRRVKTGMISAGSIPVHSLRASPRWAPVHDSDHWAFRNAGLPGVLVTDTAYLRYDHYHSPEDTPDKLDYEMMARLVRALHGVLWEGGRP